MEGYKGAKEQLHSFLTLAQGAKEQLHSFLTSAQGANEQLHSFLTSAQGAKEQLHSFLTSALDGGGWLTSPPGTLSQENKPRLAGPHHRSGHLVERKVSCPYRDSNFELPSPYPCINIYIYMCMHAYIHMYLHK